MRQFFKSLIVSLLFLIYAAAIFTFFWTVFGVFFSPRVVP